MTLDEVELSEIENTLASFQPQTETDMCLSACILNMINELGKRLGIRGLKYGLKEINRLCDYRKGMQCNDSIIPKVLSDELEPFGYIYNESRGDENNIDTLAEKINNENMSYPIVNVAPRYFEEVGIRIMGKVKIDHVLLVMGVNESTVYFYDPYEKFLLQSSKVKYAPRDLPKPLFLVLWNEAYDSRWVAWLEPTKTKQLKMETFDE